MFNFRIQFDGGLIPVITDRIVRGYPAFAFVAYDSEGNIIQSERYVEDNPNLTVPIAEYKGLIAGLTWLSQYDKVDRLYDRVLITGDSQLIIRQISGMWRVNNATLMEYFQVAHDLGKGIRHLTYRWIPRGQNEVADSLCNMAIQEWKAAQRKSNRQKGYDHDVQSS